jgi:DNA-binding response OmpR family regulator
VRVLVIDDDADVRLVVQAALHGREVYEACDAPSALALLAVTPIDVVLVDVMLPDVDGFELLARIRADRDLATLPAIMLTAKAGEADHVVAFRAGADAYLTKPFDIDALAALLDDVLARDAHEREAIRRRELERAELLLSLEHRFGAGA